MFSGLGRTTRTVPPARSISQASSVARGEQLVGGRAARARAPRGGTPAASGPPTGGCARASARPSAVLADLLDRVRHRRGGDHASAPERSSSASARSNSSGRRQRPRRVVDDHRIPVAAPRASAARTDSRAHRAAGDRDRARRARRRARRRAARPRSARPRPPPAARRRSTRASACPASVTSALGRPDPRRSPRPAATINATAISHARTLLRRRPPPCRCRCRRPFGLESSSYRCSSTSLLVHLERIHQLGGEDLLGAGEHLLLARREALLATRGWRGCAPPRRARRCRPS